MLLKYYPKYCHNLHLDSSSRSLPAVISRIKQIKLTKNFKYDHADINKRKNIISLFKRLLSNKRRSLKTLPSITHQWGFGSYSFMETCLFFPGIKTLDVCFYSFGFSPSRENDFASKTIEKQVLRYYGYFWETLRNLQYLNIRTSSPYLWLILEKIQASEKFPSSLKIFALKVVPFTGSAQNNYQTTLFQNLLKYQDLLKYVTHLDFDNYEKFHYYGVQVKAIIDSCPRLLSLTFPIQEEFSTPKKKHLTLAPLKSLQNVAELTLKVYDVWSFIEAFEFPSGLKKLELHLYYQSCWTVIWKKLYQERNQEKLKKMLAFFEKFKLCTCLKSLELNMPRFTDTKEIMDNFILPMLRSVPKLEDFQCQFYKEYLQNNEPFDLSIFLDGIGTLQQLRSLNIFQR